MVETVATPWRSAIQNVLSCAQGDGVPITLRQDIKILKAFGLHRHFLWRKVVEIATRRLRFFEAENAHAFDPSPRIERGKSVVSIGSTTSADYRRRREQHLGERAEEHRQAARDGGAAKKQKN